MLVFRTKYEMTTWMQGKGCSNHKLSLVHLLKGHVNSTKAAKWAVVAVLAPFVRYSVCAYTRASGDHGEGWEGAAVMGDAF